MSASGTDCQVSSLGERAKSISEPAMVRAGEVARTLSSPLQAAKAAAAWTARRAASSLIR